jgi:hypothetical protein
VSHDETSHGMETGRPLSTVARFQVWAARTSKVSARIPFLDIITIQQTFQNLHQLLRCGIDKVYTSTKSIFRQSLYFFPALCLPRLRRRRPCLCVCLCVYVYLCVFVCLCVCVQANV